MDTFHRFFIFWVWTELEMIEVKVKKRKRLNFKFLNLVNNLMNKESEKISLMLDFLFKNCRDKRIRSLLGRGKKFFYQIPCEELGRKSLLQYIDSQGNRMVRQKEELIDLAIKIQKIKQEAQLIEKFKRELARNNAETARDPAPRGTACWR